MQTDPMAEWQRITAVYRGMYDDELINLAADAEDLTDIARQVLNDELKRRGLGDIAKPGLVQTLPEPMRERRAALLGNQGGAPQLVLDHRANYDSHSGTIEYTWKTLLCECETLEKAQQLKDHLKLAGIDSWIDDPNLVSRFKGFESPRPRVLVAADQLEQARAVAADPIPREDLEGAAEPLAGYFKMPVCPGCGAKDPALEGVNPFNSWRCDACGNQWTESGDYSTSTPSAGT
jgi:hypothetical protein